MENITMETKIEFEEPIQKVWNGLTDPAIVKQYFFGTDLASDWKVGSPISFSGEWDGKKYVDGGTILEIDPPGLLKYSYWSSMAGTADVPENYADITYQLSEVNGITILTITQDNVKSQQAAEHSAQNWKSIFDGLKAILKKMD